MSTPACQLVMCCLFHYQYILLFQYQYTLEYSLLPASPSAPSAKQRFEIFFPPMIVVRMWFSRASFTVYYRKMLKSVCDNIHSWRNPTEVWNHSAILSLTRTALVTLGYNCWIVCIRFIRYYRSSLQPIVRRATPYL